MSTVVFSLRASSSICAASSRIGGEVPSNAVAGNRPRRSVRYRFI